MKYLQRPGVEAVTDTDPQLSHRWHLSHRADPRAVPIADRHYNRQKVGSPQIAPPGSCVVFLTTNADAVWITSNPKAEFVKHAWAGAWMNSLFRNESSHLSSSLVTEAVAMTRWYYGEPPPLGMVTFVSPTHVRHKRDLGRCYRKAGFKEVGETKGGLTALQLLPADMPLPIHPRPFVGESE